MHALASRVQRLLLGALLVLLAGGAHAQIEGEYVGRFGFYRSDHLAAELKIESGWFKKFTGTLTFTHFEYPIGTQRVRSTCKVEGRYDERYKSVTFTFKEWVGKPPIGDWSMGNRNGKLEGDLLTGDGFELARKGTPAAQKFIAQQPTWDRHAERQRSADDEHKKRSGQYALEERKYQIARAERGDTIENTTAPIQKNKDGAVANVQDVPVDWPALGLRVVMREVQFADFSVPLPFVLAVRENGGAFYTGVQPGDAIVSLHCGQRGGDYVELQRPGNRAEAVYRGIGSAVKNESLIVEPAQYCAGGGMIRVTVAMPSAETRKLLYRLPPADEGGAWISDKQVAAQKLEAAQAAIEVAYRDARNRAFEELRANPCAHAGMSPHDTRSMPPVLRQLAVSRLRVGIEADMSYWRDIVLVYCDESKNGKLPSFETAIYQIGRGALDPCTYDPKVDYTQIEENPEKRTRRYARWEYEDANSVRYFLGKLATPETRQCLIDLLRAQVTGKPFVPRR
jgi:hypothetical protein